MSHPTTILLKGLPPYCSLFDRGVGTYRLRSESSTLKAKRIPQPRSLQGGFPGSGGLLLRSGLIVRFQVLQGGRLMVCLKLLSKIFDEGKPAGLIRRVLRLRLLSSWSIFEHLGASQVRSSASRFACMSHKNPRKTQEHPLFATSLVQEKRFFWRAKLKFSGQRWISPGAQSDACEGWAVATWGWRDVERWGYGSRKTCFSTRVSVRVSFISICYCWFG